METSDDTIVLVTDQHPLSGIGVYATRLWLLLRESFPNICLRNLHYFGFTETEPHRPIPGQRFAHSRIDALPALRRNMTLFTKWLPKETRLVHLCGASYGLAGRDPPAVATVHDFGLRSITSLWGVEPRLLPWEMYAFVNSFRTPRALRRCRRLVSISESTQTVLKRRTGLSSVVIHHWMEGERFRPRSRSVSRKLLELPEDRRILLNVSSYASNKNLPLLRRLIRRLPSDYLLVKIGHPVMDEEGRVRNIRSVPEDVYPLYFSAADAYVHVSRMEGFGWPLLEAMASSTPVIALANPPVPEVLGAAGHLVSSTATVGQLAAEICAVLESPEELQRVSRGGIERARSFGPVEARERYSEVYLSMLRR